jgi:hypothetical protein
MEYVASSPAMVVPPAGAKIFINADLSGQTVPTRIVGNDERQVADLRDHGIIAIGFALPVVARVDVDIGDDGHLQLATFLPNHAEPGTIELDDSVVETVRIDVVVKEKLLDSSGPAVGAAKQERAAFTPITGAASEFINTRIPNPRAADQPRRPA